jgi:hypothetical protein
MSPSIRRDGELTVRQAPDPANPAGGGGVVPAQGQRIPIAPSADRRR